MLHQGLFEHKRPLSSLWLAVLHLKPVLFAPFVLVERGGGRHIATHPRPRMKRLTPSASPSPRVRVARP